MKGLDKLYAGMW